MGTNDLQLLKRDSDCERYVLGSIMLDKEVLPEIQEMLSEDCFYVEFHRQIYKAIVLLESKGERADVLRVKSVLEETYPDFDVVELAKISGEFLSEDVSKAAARLHALRIRRQFNVIGNRLMENSFTEKEDILDVVEGVCKELSGLFTLSQDSVFSLREAVERVYDQINRNMAGAEKLTGTPTGFRKLDSRSGGLQPSDLVIIAGETSIGKTSFAVSIMRFAALSGKKVAMYSMEMRKEQIAARILSMETGIPSNELLYSAISPSQLRVVDERVSQIQNLGIYFDDRSTSGIDTILSSIRHMKLKYNIDGAVVDYLQILNVNMKNANKEQQMGDVARRLKNMAKDLGIWIIALSQLNRDSQNPVPTLSRLRDSGQIAEAADMVALIYRPELYGRDYPDEFSNVSTKNTAMINVAKGRNTGLVKFICGFNPSLTMFYDLEEMPVRTADEEKSEEDYPF